MGSLDSLWVTGSGIASATNATRAGGIRGVGAVQPVHGDSAVIPDRQDKHHALKSLAHLGKTALGLEVVGVVEGSLLLRAEAIRNAIGCVDARDVGHGVGDRLAVLDIEAGDLAQRARGGAVVGDELGHHGEWLGGVERHAGSVELGVPHAVRVEVAARLVTETLGAGISITAGRGILTAGRSIRRARMGGESSSDGVSLPVIEIST